MAKKSAKSRGAIWRNNKRGLKKQRCQGTYKVIRGKRKYILNDTVDTTIFHPFDSHEAAKQDGWYKA